ncbi:MAG: FGGY-family carbohydrate kinase, partial [Nitrosomonas sp.]|nr:FGGY-family carbohydrate kinase [Nitrosomonas sp.]
IWRWTHGKHHIMDVSMAARTSLMDIHQQQWSLVLCDLFNIPLSILPQIRPSTGLKLPLDNGMILNASVGDQSAALIACVTNNPTEALVNLGTGGFVMRYLATQNNTLDGYLLTLIYQDEKKQTHTAIEGTLNSIAAALAPYPVRQCQADDLAKNDIFCLAEPSGLGAPYFRDDWGLFFSQPTDQLTPTQITALLLEAIIFRVARILEEFHQQSPITQAYLSGGLSELTCLQQGIAQCVPFPVYHLQQKETSLQGAALLASGLKTKHTRQAEKIKADSNNAALIEKYHCWKDWLDTLLRQARYFSQPNELPIE